MGQWLTRWWGGERLRLDVWLDGSLGFGLELVVVVANEGADVVRDVEQSCPLLLVERHGKPSETVHRQATFLAHLDRDSGWFSVLEGLVF